MAGLDPTIQAEACPRNVASVRTTATTCVYMGFLEEKGGDALFLSVRRRDGRVKPGHDADEQWMR
jgi:hypothetical protein